MHPEWHDYLLARGATIVDGVVVGFDAAAASDPRTELICDLSHHAIISVSGTDADEFLQGQLTNDLRQLSEQCSQLSAWCSPKGRVLAIFRIIRREGKLYLLLPRDLLARVLQRLRMYILRADVQVDDASDEMVRFGIQGSAAQQALQDSCGDAPASDHQVRACGELSLVRVPGEVPRFEVIGPLPPAQALWEALASSVAAVAAQCWALGDILAGIPSIDADSSDQYLPQMLNLELLGSVSFDKGCYAGQEIVARTQHLGRLKRRMYGAHIVASPPPPQGTPIFDAGAPAKASVGKILIALPASGSDTAALVVLGIDHAQSVDLRIGDSGGPRLVLRPLPYLPLQP